MVGVSPEPRPYIVSAVPFCLVHRSINDVNYVEPNRDGGP
jgi:hypothetical protein